MVCWFVCCGVGQEQAFGDVGQWKVCDSLDVLPQVVKLHSLLHIYNAKLGSWVWGECTRSVFLSVPSSSQITWNLKGRSVTLIIQSRLLLLTLDSVWLEKDLQWARLFWGVVHYFFSCSQQFWLDTEVFMHHYAIAPTAKCRLNLLQ